MNQIQKPKVTAASAAEASDIDLTDSDIEITETVPKPKVKNAPLNKIEKKSKKIALTPIDVVATQAGFYGNRRIKEDEKFKLEDETDFSHNWMKKI
jgi:hypothetical protein